MKRILLCVVLLGWSTMACAVVYKWVNAKGIVQYGDTPPDGAHATIVRLLGTDRPSTPPSSAAAPTPATPSLGDQVLAARKRRELQQSVNTDVAAARKQQCAAAQAHYQQLINGRHMYTLGPNGQRDYLSSSQIDAARLNAKRRVDKLCSGGGSS